MRLFYVLCIALALPTSIFAQNIPRGEVTPSDVYAFLQNTQCEWISGIENVSINDSVLTIYHDPTPGGDKGSTHFITPCPITGATDAITVSYKVKFAPGFDFKLGGKIHGVCGGTCPSGGKPDPNGMMARMIWKNGTFQMYLYHRDQEGQFGDHFDTKVPIITDEWIQFTYHVSAGTKTTPGSIRVSINGTDVFSKNFQFKDESSDDWTTNKFVVSAFHGGDGAPKWVPDRPSISHLSEIVLESSAKK